MPSPISYYAAAILRRWAGSLGLLLGSAGPAVAQSPPTPPADTAAALHRLFAHQRQGEQRALLVSGGSVVLYNYFLSFSSQETTKDKVATGLLAAYLGYQTYNLTRSIARLRRYRPAHEQRLLAAMRQGQPLPRWCRRRLVPYLRPVPVAPDTTRR